MRGVLAIAWACALVAACGSDEVAEPRATGGGAGSAADASTPDGSAGSTGSGGAGGSGAGTGGAAGAGGGTPDPCASIVPSATPGENHSTIQGCLQASGHALLADGSFDVPQGISVPAGAVLGAAPGANATLRLVETTTNYLVTLATGSKVEGLVLDANNALPAQLNEAVVHVSGDDAVVSKNTIRNPAAPPPGSRSTGIYFICGTCQGALATENVIENLFYGVIFVHALDAAHPNTLDNNEIRQIKCDSVTIAGFGRVIGNVIHDTGWDCENGPIPGGGIYCLGSPNGGEIVGNTITNQCGMNVDVDGCAKLTIKNNQLHDPGNTFGGTAPWCTAAFSLGMVDIRDSLVEGNTVTNSGRTHNRVGASNDPNSLFKASGAAAFSDLPHGADQAIAFLFSQRPNTPLQATGNTIKNNTFIANCPGNCVGLGFFASRSTGIGPGGWSASTTNYFTENDVFGSQVGSKRCGANWYAASSTCNGPGADAPECNQDDHQHNPPVGDWARNDPCATY